MTRIQLKAWSLTLTIFVTSIPRFIEMLKTFFQSKAIASQVLIIRLKESVMVLTLPVSGRQNSKYKFQVDTIPKSQQPLNLLNLTLLLKDSSESENRASLNDLGIFVLSPQDVLDLILAKEI